MIAHIPRGCILAIVGSTQLEGVPRAHIVVGLVLDVYVPRKVVSGGAPGIDKIAASAARARGIDVEEFLPAEPNWERGFKPRNIKVGDVCEALVRIAASNSKTYGSGWTRDYAKKLGKPTREFLICMACNGTGADPMSDNTNWLPCSVCKNRPVKDSEGGAILSMVRP
jgi:hypothetical protein